VASSASKAWVLNCGRTGETKYIKLKGALFFLFFLKIGFRHKHCSFPRVLVPNKKPTPKRRVQNRILGSDVGRLQDLNGCLGKPSVTQQHRVVKLFLKNIEILY
jgi:hypothetical protein